MDGDGIWIIGARDIDCCRVKAGVGLRVEGLTDDNVARRTATRGLEIWWLVGAATSMMRSNEPWEDTGVRTRRTFFDWSADGGCNEGSSSCEKTEIHFESRYRCWRLCCAQLMANGQ